MSTDTQNGSEMPPQAAPENPTIASVPSDPVSTSEAVSTDAPPAPAPSEPSSTPPAEDTQAGATTTPSPDSSAPTITETPPATPALPADSPTPPTTPTEPAPTVAPPSAISDGWRAMFADSGFLDYLESHLLEFLNIMDIENNGVRRDALVALKLNEDGIRARLDLAEAFILMQQEYAAGAALEKLTDEINLLSSKHEAMKAWLTIK